MTKPTATNPVSEGGEQYHIACKKGDLAKYLLLPGDAGRVDKIVKSWDKKEKISSNREYDSITGVYGGANLSCMSTGMGAPAMGIAIEEAARIGVDTFLRVGSTGALKEGIDPGDIVITAACIRDEGLSKSYVKEIYPAYANYEMILALIEACEKLGVTYHVGTTITTDSFYIGEGRPGFGGYNQSYNEHVLEDWTKAGAINIEMEASALLTLANLYGLRAGAACVVFDNLVTNEFKKVGEEKLGKVASEAISILAKWDKLKKEKNRKYFYPSLS